jgi:large subunit ribosomal protein L25
MITISCKARTKQSKGDASRLRRDGFVPFVLYSKGQPAEMGSLARHDMEAVIRGLRAGFLTTTVFQLKDESGRERQAIVREIQYKPTTYEILHVDFLELTSDCPVELKVPVELANVVDCVGVKLGGTIRPIRRHVLVRCLPGKIPEYFELDMKEMGIGNSRRVKDIVIPKGVTCLESAEEVVVSVVKK